MATGLKRWRWPGAAAIALAAALLFLTPALAQDGNNGNITLNDDVSGNQYLFGNAITVNGDVNGDLTAFGRSLTINGNVNGDVLFAGSWLLVKGKVDGDIRGAGGQLILDKNATVTGDLAGAGYSIEMRPGSSVGGQVLAAGGQVILESVAKDAQIATGSLRVNGVVKGDVQASVGTASQTNGGDPFAGMRSQDPNMPVAAVVPGGLSFGQDGKIAGKLEYHSTKETDIPAGVVAGKTTFVKEETSQERQQSDPRFFSSDTGKAAGYFVASLLVLSAFGGLLLKFRPGFLNGAADTLRRRTLASLGAGALGYIVFLGLVIGLLILVVLLVIPLSFVAMGGRFFGTILLTGIGAGTAFIVLTNWLAPLVVGLVIGEWLYAQVEKERKSPFWSLVLGLVIVLLANATPFVGSWLVAGLVAAFGLGAIILSVWPARPAAAAAVEAPRGEIAPTAPAAQ